MNKNSAEDFVNSWGSMGVLWGINRSMARIHALLICTDEPMSLDQVAEKLNISRGNASMSLKELRNWGVIRRVFQSGDRKDYYVAEEDIWKMFFLIVGERKKREFDPALETIRTSLEHVDTDLGPKGRNRMEQMETLLSTVDKLATKFLADEKTSKSMLDFLSASPL